MCVCIYIYVCVCVYVYVCTKVYENEYIFIDTFGLIKKSNTFRWYAEVLGEIRVLNRIGLKCNYLPKTLSGAVFFNSFSSFLPLSNSSSWPPSLSPSHLCLSVSLSLSLTLCIDVYLFSIPLHLFLLFSSLYFPFPRSLFPTSLLLCPPSLYFTSFFFGSFCFLHSFSLSFSFTLSFSLSLSLSLSLSHTHPFLSFRFSSSSFSLSSFLLSFSLYAFLSSNLPPLSLSINLSIYSQCHQFLISLFSGL